MNQRALTILEYDKICDRLRTHLASGVGREASFALQPVSDLQEAERLLQQTEEADAILPAHRPYTGRGVSGYPGPAGAHPCRPCADHGRAARLRAVPACGEKGAGNAAWRRDAGAALRHG